MDYVRVQRRSRVREHGDDMYWSRGQFSLHTVHAIDVIKDRINTKNVKTRFYRQKNCKINGKSNKNVILFNLQMLTVVSKYRSLHIHQFLLRHLWLN